MIGYLFACLLVIFALCLVVVGTSAPTAKNRADALLMAAIFASAGFIVGCVTAVMT